MGKLTLLLVTAAVIGGTTLTFSVRALSGDTARGRAESQADLLARQIAETGQGLVLAAVTGDEGFVSLGAPTTRAYEGGEFTAATTSLSADGREITVTVQGRYGGAIHTIETTYAFDPMNYPGPIWLDVPYASATAAPGAQVAGGADELPYRWDSRKHTDLGIATGLPRDPMVAALQTVAAATGNALSVPSEGEWSPTGPLLEDLSLNDDIGSAEDLYMAAVSAMDANDQTFATAQTVTSSVTWGGRARVTRVRGNLRVDGFGAHLAGEGVLLVEGPLEVVNGGRLTWNGIVMVHDMRTLLPVDLTGRTTITGGLVVVQDAFPPGGHLDLTVNLERTGLANPVGRRPGPRWPTESPMDYTFYEHTHGFDITPVGAPRGNTVHFAQNGAGPHEEETRFWEFMHSIANTPIALEFVNAQHHGFSRFSLSLAGDPQPKRGLVRSGFGAFAAGGNVFRSQTFDADDLRSLSVEVQSLRALKERFDGQGGCDLTFWPLCIGRDWGRGGAMAMRVVRPSDAATLYEATMYWHMRQDEVAAHEAAEAAWLAQLQSGTAFGTRLVLGSNTQITYSLAEINRLEDKLGFDGNEILVVNTTRSHLTAAEARAAGAATIPATPATPTPPVTPLAPTAPADGGMPTSPSGLPPGGTTGAPTPEPPDVPATAAHPPFPFEVCMPGGQTRLVSNNTRYTNWVVRDGAAIGACP